ENAGLGEVQRRPGMDPNLYEKRLCKFYKFILQASYKLHLPPETNVLLKDCAGVDVDADIFDDVLQAEAEFSGS
ncbi:hypothetical protein IRJ41_019740, partial [Triplophysa rosa]